jgi:hypothetical protein
MHPYVKDLTGQTFGRLHVLCAAARPENAKGRGQHWACICSCANEIVVRSDSLVQGWATSCGCTNEKARKAREAIGPRRTKSTVSVHPSQDWTKHTHNAITSMNETNTTISDEPTVEPKLIGVKLIELEALRNTLNNVTAATVIPALRAANAAVDRIIAEAKPKASYANENDKPRKLMTDATGFIGGLNSHDAPRTVKGETLSEQADRLRGLPGNVKLPPAGEERTRLKFKPVLNNLSERKHSHYFRKCPYDAVDVYRVLDLFAITDQALGHAIKKLLVAGGRGAGKDIGTDIQEAIDTLQRWQEMRQEDTIATANLLELMKA